MGKFSKISLMPMLAAFALAMGACSDDAPQEDSKKTDFGVNDAKSTLTSEQQKQRLESVATEASQMFRPEDHRQVIELANYWEQRYSGLEIPDEWESIVNGSTNTPAAVLTSLAQSLKHGDISTLAFNTFNYYYEFSQFTGIFEPGRYSWNKVGDSNDIVFRFYNDASQLVEVKVTASGSNADFTVGIDDERYTVKAPKLIETTITENGERIMWSRSNVSFNEASHVVDFDIIADVANIHASAEVHVTDNRITGNSNTTIGGNLLANADFVVNGEGMATRSIIEDIIDDPIESSQTKLCNMFKTATVNTDVLGEIQVKGEMSDLNSIIDLSTSFDNYDFDDREAARQACQQSCDIMARAIKSRMYFDGSNVMEAELVYKPSLDEYNSYYYSWWEWYVEPMLKFADGTTYSMEGYFTTSRFASVENTWTNLWDSYSRLWR